jgi:outer membrane immunogenic protein
LLRGKFLSRLLLLQALVGPAFAADLLPQKDAPVYVAPPTIFSWTGFYIGADVGGGWGENVAAIAATPITPAGVVTTHLSGVVGGGFVGYNYQINQFVIGVQGDIQASGLSGATYSPLFDVTEKVRQDEYLGAINGRLGFAFDRALFYAIGGAAFTHNSADHFAGPALTTLLGQFGVPATPVNLSHDWTGFDIGGGVEYAITPNWTARVEYRYYDFGAWNFPTTAWVTHGTVKLTDNTVTFGVSYLFGGPAAAPVPAKY